MRATVARRSATTAAHGLGVGLEISASRVELGLQVRASETSRGQPAVHLWQAVNAKKWLAVDDHIR
jgi:hypothetical protein